MENLQIGRNRLKIESCKIFDGIIFVKFFSANSLPFERHQIIFMDPQLESELNKIGFTILEKLGQGGFGSVWHVKWEKYPESSFVIKIISRLSQSSINSYNNEIESLMKLEHKNIIYVFKHFTIENHYCIVLEYCSRGNLADYVKFNGPLSVENFKIIVCQLISALQACHNMGIAHLDIKPENILLNEYNQVKLSDFGLAVHAEEDSLCTQQGGSPIYCAPERFTGLYDAFKSDVWSLGMTCYYLIYGVLPYTNVNRQEYMRLITKYEIKFPTAIDERVYNFIHMSLDRDSRNRPSIDQISKYGLFTINCDPVHRIGPIIKMSDSNYQLPFMPRAYSSTLFNHFKVSSRLTMNRHSSEIRF